MANKAVIDVILGEARAGDFQDMLAIASVIANRAAQLGVSLEDVLHPDEFDALTPAPGTEKYREMAAQALEQVMTTGPVHSGTFYAKSTHVGGLPSGLQKVSSTAGHQFFEDPENRPIRTNAGTISPSSVQIASSTFAPTPNFAPNDRPNTADTIPGDDLPALQPPPSGSLNPIYTAKGAHKWSIDRNAPHNIKQTLQRDASTRGLFGAFSNKTLPINDAIAKVATSREKNTKGSQHFRGNALDYHTKNLTDDEKIALVNSGFLSGNRGFGLGRNITHMDSRPAGAAWSYGIDQYAGIPVSDWKDALNENTLPDAVIDRMNELGNPGIPTPTPRPGLSVPSQSFTPPAPTPAPSMPWDGLVDIDPSLGISMAGDEYIGSPNFGTATAAEPQKDASIPGEFSGYNPSPYPAMDMTTVPDELAMSQYAGTFGMQRGIPSIADELETGFNPTYGLDPTPQAPQQSTQVAPGLFSNFDAQTGLPNPGAFGAPAPLSANATPFGFSSSTAQASPIGFGVSTNASPGLGASAGAKTGMDLSSLSGPASPDPTITAPQNDIDPVDILGAAVPDLGAPLGANVGSFDFTPNATPQAQPAAPQPDVTNINVDQHGNITYGQPQQQSQPGGLFGGLFGSFANQNNGFFGPSGLFGDPAGGFLGQGFGYFGGGGGTGPTGGGFNGWGGGWSPASWGGGFGWSQHGDPAQSDGYYD